jgi:hypothetical protein
MISEEILLRPWTVKWVKHFRAHKEYSAVKFKILNCGYPKFNLPEGISVRVEVDEFIAAEENRIALFIGTQFGIYPNINKIPGIYNTQKRIAILAKSMLSGCVAGLGIYMFPSIINSNEDIENGNLRKKIIFFKNED